MTIVLMLIALLCLAESGKSLAHECSTAHTRRS
jgi:hypothetical protein